MAMVGIMAIAGSAFVAPISPIGSRSTVVMQWGRSYSMPPIDDDRRSRSPGLANNFYEVPISDFKRPYGGGGGVSNQAYESDDNYNYRDNSFNEDRGYEDRDGGRGYRGDNRRSGSTFRQQISKRGLGRFSGRSSSIASETTGRYNDRSRWDERGYSNRPLPFRGNRERGYTDSYREDRYRSYDGDSRYRDDRYHSDRYRNDRYRDDRYRDDRYRDDFYDDDRYDDDRYDDDRYGYDRYDEDRYRGYSYLDDRYRDDRRHAYRYRDDSRRRLRGRGVVDHGFVDRGYDSRALGSSGGLGSRRIRGYRSVRNYADRDDRYRSYSLDRG